MLGVGALQKEMAFLLVPETVILTVTVVERMIANEALSPVGAQNVSSSVTCQTQLVSPSHGSFNRTLNI